MLNIFKNFFLEDTADEKSFSMSRLMVFIGGIGAFIITLTVGYLAIKQSENLDAMITFCLTFWGLILGGKALNRYAENKEDIKKEINDNN